MIEEMNLEPRAIGGKAVLCRKSVAIACNDVENFSTQQSAISMESNSSEVFYSLYFILFFDLMILVSLGYYYRKLGYRFLKYGAAAMAIEMMSQSAYFIGALLVNYNLPFVLGGIGRMIYAALMLACVAIMVNRVVPLKLMLGSVMFYLGNGIFVAVSGDFTLTNWIVAEAPTVLLLLVGVNYLFAARRRESLAFSWLAGLFMVHVGLKLTLPFLLQDPTVFVLTFFYNSVVVMMMGVMLVMVSSEWMSGSLAAQNTRLEEFELENRRLENQFAQAQKFEGLGVLASGVAHEFNNMLTSIMGYASLAMKKLPMNSDIRKDLYMVLSGARQAVNLTSQILRYSERESVKAEYLDISEVVDHMSSLINATVPRKIKVILKVTRELPPTRGDKGQLRQVLLNLVANAVGAIGEETGIIEISTGLVEIDEAFLSESELMRDPVMGSYLYLSVADSGMAASTDLVEKALDPLVGEGDREGLGLSSLSGVVRQHLGFIRVSSTEESGSRMTTYFPVAILDDGALNDSQESKGETEATVSALPFVAEPDISVSQDEQELIQPKGRVLLSDDDKRIRSLISSILESDGFELTTAQDGEDAMSRISAEGDKFTLFLLDCTMPKLSGFEVYQEIRSRGLTTPVILISGYYQSQIVNNISDDQDAYFIKKPFNVDDLLRQVNMALAQGLPDAAVTRQI